MAWPVFGSLDPAAALLSAALLADAAAAGLLLRLGANVG
jgi:hypothetical protein